MAIKSKTNYIERELHTSVTRWIKEREIIAISGSRQAGKTTLLKQIMLEVNATQKIFIDLEQSTELEAFNRNPNEYIQLKVDLSNKAYIFIDEIQYLNSAGKILKELYDKYPKLKLIISGSSSLKIKDIANALVGRIVFFNLYPLTFGEFLSNYNHELYKLWQKYNKLFNNQLKNKEINISKPIYLDKLNIALNEYIKFGGYPSVVISKLDLKNKKIKGMIETYIEKDVIKLLKIGDYMLYKKLVKSLAIQTGNLLNNSSIMQELDIPYIKFHQYVDALESTFIIKQLLPYSTNQQTELRRMTKLFFVDSGLRNGLIDNYQDLTNRPDAGNLVENFVCQNLIYREHTRNIQFWRTKQQAEVDFIMSIDNQKIPIEVKYQKMSKPNISRSFGNYLQKYKPAAGIILSKNITAVRQIGVTRVLFLPIYFV